jgi:hypothetical protein
MALRTCGGIWNSPLIFKWVKAAMSFRVIVISPTGRWKEDVSWCHLSENAPIRPLSMIEYKKNNNGDKPESGKTEQIRSLVAKYAIHFLP